MNDKYLTLVLRLENEEGVKEIFEAFKSNEYFHGTRIRAVGWEHSMQERDKYKAAAEAAFRDGRSGGLVFGELPNYIVVGEGKVFHHAGHGVFSTMPEPNQFQGEWYPHYDDLKRAYPILPEDPYDLP